MQSANKQFDIAEGRPRSNNACPIWSSSLPIRWLPLALLAASRPAISEGLSATPTVATDYDFRGISQTADGTAIQLGIDYTGARNHFQVWTSNIKFERAAKFYGNGSREICLTADAFVGNGTQLKYDAGISYYAYPGRSPNENYPEVFSTLARGWFSTSVYYSWNYGNLDPHLSAYYVETNGTWSIAKSAINLAAHAGHSWGPYWNVINGGGYGDYWIGISKSVGRFDVNLRVVSTIGYASIPRAEPFSGVARVVLSIETTIPWMGEQQ